MAIDLIPNNKNCIRISVSVDTWKALAANTPIETMVPSVVGIPLGADKETSLKCADIVREWTPPAYWFPEAGADGKTLFLQFFKNCDGFRAF